MGKIVDRKYWGDEIPKDVSYKDYLIYIMSNISNEICKKNRNIPYEAWSEFDRKEYHSAELRITVARCIQKWDENALTERQKRIIEYVRNGTDFDISTDELDYLFRK